jgi:hypothetical protein
LYHYLFFCHYFAHALLCRNAGRTTILSGTKKELRQCVIGKGSVLQATLESWLWLKLAYDGVFLAYAYADDASWYDKRKLGLSIAPRVAESAE